jgi:hypothetical protein
MIYLFRFLTCIHSFARARSRGFCCHHFMLPYAACVRFFDNYIDALSHFTETNFDGMKVVDVDTYKSALASAPSCRRDNSVTMRNSMIFTPGYCTTF